MEFEPWIAEGKRTGHALAQCSECGFISMLSIVNSSGTRRGRPSVGWPRCPLTGCTGRRVIDERAFADVPRLRPPGIPQLRPWARAHGHDALLERLDLLASRQRSAARALEAEDP